MNTSGISPSFLGLSRSSGQVTHVLLTRSRLCPRASPGSSLHLHVLSTPPAFVLSQDQTLREEPRGTSPRGNRERQSLLVNAPGRGAPAEGHDASRRHKRPHAKRASQYSAQEATCTWTVRSRGRSSKS